MSRSTAQRQPVKHHRSQQCRQEVAEMYDSALALVERTGVELPCWSTDPELFFAESPADVERAKALCVGCPLQTECLAGALERREPWGVWGGQLVLQGVVVPRKRPRGRPRKDSVETATSAELVPASGKQAVAA
jgi:WhiB family transcriptional regulator, redox-sensing transcriptional regulator